MSDRAKLMANIGACDFAILDVSLFLDTNPANADALVYYNHHRIMRQKAVDEYECKYGPLTLCGNKDPDYWRWIDDPWPWDVEV